jgi:hypothetical protein
VIRSRIKRGVEHEARMGMRRCAYRVWLGNLRERNHLEDLGVDGRIILKWIFKKRHSSLYWIDLAQDRDRSRILANDITKPAGKGLTS